MTEPTKSTEIGLEARRLLGYLWQATGKNYLRPVYTLFDDADPIIEDIARLAIFAETPDDERLRDD